MALKSWKSLTTEIPSSSSLSRARLAQELVEELPFLAHASAAFPEPLTQCLQQAELLSIMTRELRRCGKPELFFTCPWPLMPNKC